VLRLRLAGGPGLLLLDVLVLAWALTWVAAGFVLAREMRDLAELGDTAARSGRAAIAVGDVAAGLPLVGEQVRDAAEEVRRAGAAAVASADGAREDTRRLGDLLGLAIAAIPSLPLLVLYLPARVTATRERREVKGALESGDRDALDRLLALRAVTRLPLHRLREVSDDPAGDLRDGRHERLADAELRMLGLSRPRARAADDR
jgi:hypothetical protein